MRHWRSRRGWARLERPARRRAAYALGLLFIAALALLWYWRSQQVATSGLPVGSLPVLAAEPHAEPATVAVAGDPAREAIGSSDAAEREVALRRLEGDPSDAAESRLLAVLREDPDPAIRLLAVELLQRRALSRGDAGRRIEDGLGAAVADADENVGEAAIDALAELAVILNR